MVIFLKAGGELGRKLQPNVDTYTRRVDAEEGKSLREILQGIGVSPGFVAFAVKGERIEHLSLVPEDGDTITLLPPVSGG
jgi:molybdopterin converting factor small subunit